MKQEIIAFLKSKEMKTFYWQTGVNALGLIGMALAGTDWVYAPIVLAVLNGITKYINKTYL